MVGRDHKVSRRRVLHDAGGLATVGMTSWVAAGVAAAGTTRPGTHHVVIDRDEHLRGARVGPIR